MRGTATNEVIRIMGLWIRRADAGLAQVAARNAANSIAASRATRLEAARTLHDLQAVLPTRDVRDLRGAREVDHESVAG